MMDHKTMEQRGARADFQLIIAEIMGNEDKRKELIEKYGNAEKHLENKNVQRILIGNWLHNGATMLLRGATEDELYRVAEYIVVLIHAVKFHMDVYQAHRDNNLLELVKKYMRDHKKMKVDSDENEIYIEGSTMAERAKRNEEVLKKRKELVERAQKK